MTEGSLTTTEYAALLRDALALWGEPARLAVEGERLVITRGEAVFTITRGPAPTRWFLQAPGRGPRPAPSITALLDALRRAMGVAEAPRLVGGS